MLLRIKTLSLFIIISIIVSPLALAQNSIPEKPDNPVLDIAGIIDDATENRLNGYLKELEQKTTAQVIVLTIFSLKNESIKDFSTRIARDKWKLGKKGKDNGVLLVIAMKDRKYRIEIGYGLIGNVLTDRLVSIMERNILVPYLRKGDYSEGIFTTTLAMANKIAEDAGVKIEGMPSIQYSTLSVEEEKEMLKTINLYEKVRNEHKIEHMIRPYIPYIAMIIVFILGLSKRKNTSDKRKREEKLKKDQENKRSRNEYQRSGENQGSQSEEYQKKEEERRRQEERRKSEEERRRAEEQYRRNSQSNFNEGTVRNESYYASVLGLSGKVLPEDVKVQYRKLAAQYHPDKVDHLGQKLKKVAEHEMKSINEAYEFFKKKYEL